ncbi:MAG: metal-sulfur cluster assembly factor [Flexilinea sp.]
MAEEPKKKNPAVWDFSSIDPDKAELLKDALRSVLDPELGYSVIDLGLIRNVTVTDKHVLVTMILTTPFCPYGGQLVESVRRTTMDTLIMDANVDLRFDPWDPDMMEEGFDLDWGFF